MTRRRAGAWARWVLLCALAVDVVAMHHAGTVEAGHSVTTGHPAAMTMQQGMTVAIAGSGDHGQHEPGTNHDVLHLCLAVLCAAVALVATALVLRAVRSVVFPLVGQVRGSGAARPPPLRLGTDVLLATCVLRV